MVGEPHAEQGVNNIYCFLRMRMRRRNRQSYCNKVLKKILGFLILMHAFHSINKGLFLVVMNAVKSDDPAFWNFLYNIIEISMVNDFPGIDTAEGLISCGIENRKH